MGDNTVNSSDSRTWGDFSRENVIGKSFFVYWPIGSQDGCQLFGVGHHGKSRNNHELTHEIIAELWAQSRIITNFFILFRFLRGLLFKPSPSASKHTQNILHFALKTQGCDTLTSSENTLKTQKTHLERTETWVTIWTQEMGNSFRPSVSSFKSKQWCGQNGRAAETVFEL